MYLDQVFVVKELFPRLQPYSGFTNFFGETIFLEPFSGYLHTVVRVFTRLILLGSVANYPFWAFLVASFIWTFCSWLLFLAVRRIAGSIAGIFAALSLALLHGSNLILLGQLNAVQWPMLVACTIAISLEFQPSTKVGKVALAILLIATSLNAALAFIPISLLAWRLLVFRGRKRWRVFAHFCLMAIPFSLQVLTYAGQQVRTVDASNPWWYTWREIAYVPTLLLPGFLRNSTQEPPIGWPLAILLLFASVLGVTILLAVLSSFQLSKQKARSVVELVLVAICSSVASVYLNGNLNHQYVLIPSVSVWIAIILSISFLMEDSRWRCWGQVSAISCMFIFVFSSVCTWDRGFTDQFYGRPSGVNLDDAIDSIDEICRESTDVNSSVSFLGVSISCLEFKQLR